MNAAINIPTVHVGDANNPADPDGMGSVDYEYYIGTYEVTNSQYASFLNSKAATDTYGLYNSLMKITRSGSNGSYTYSVNSGYANKPIGYVSFWDATRFCNWLTTGDTETGVYNLDANGIANNTITRNQSAWNNGGVAVASQNEWHKAAYYDPTANNNGFAYWEYPTRSNSISTADAHYDTSGTADVGSYTQAPSYYGTYDQAGNVNEWNDTIDDASSRIRRGGNYSSHIVEAMSRNDFERSDSPDVETGIFGFRITSLNTIPEPSTYAIIFGSMSLFLTLILRQRSIKN